MATVSVHVAKNKEQTLMKQKAEEQGCGEDNSIISVDPLLKAQRYQRENPAKMQKTGPTLPTNAQMQKTGPTLPTNAQNAPPTEACIHCSQTLSLTMC